MYLRRQIVSLALAGSLALPVPAAAARNWKCYSLRTLGIVMTLIAGGLGYYRFVEEPEWAARQGEDGYNVPVEPGEGIRGRSHDTSRFIVRNLSPSYIYESLVALNATHPEHFRRTMIPLDSYDGFLKAVALDLAKAKTGVPIEAKTTTQKYSHPFISYTRWDVDSVFARYLFSIMAEYEERTNGLQNDDVTPSDFVTYLSKLKHQHWIREQMERGENIHPSENAVGIHLMDRANRDPALQQKLLAELKRNPEGTDRFDAQGLLYFHVRHEFQEQSGDHGSSISEVRVRFGHTELYRGELEARLERMVQAWFESTSPQSFHSSGEGYTRLTYSKDPRKFAEAYIQHLRKSK